MKQLFYIKASQLNPARRLTRSTNFGGFDPLYFNKELRMIKIENLRTTEEYGVKKVADSKTRWANASEALPVRSATRKKYK